MSTKAFTIRNYYTRDIPIDDGFDGEAVAAGETFRIRIRRFTVAQLQAFQRGFARLTSPSASRFIYRKPEGDEQAMREIQAQVNDQGVVTAPARTEHVIADTEIERRRLDEMTPERRAAFDAAGQADDEFMAQFCSQAITDFITVDPTGPPVNAVRENGESFRVQSGADLVEAFGGNLSMLVRLTRAIHHENTLSPEAKKVLRSLSGSTASSPTPAAAAAVDGATPAAIVTNAAPAGSAPSGAVLVGPDQTLCGSGELVTST